MNTTQQTEYLDFLADYHGIVNVYFHKGTLYVLDEIDFDRILAVHAQLGYNFPAKLINEMEIYG